MKAKVRFDKSDVLLLDRDMKNQLQTSFGNGTLCGKGPETMLVVQELIKNPVLYKGHKMDFRVYFFLNSAKSMVTTFYNGFGRVCPLKYNETSFATEVHISNLRTSFDHASKSSTKTIEGEQTDNFLIKTFSEVQRHLTQTYGLDFADLSYDLKDTITTILKNSRIPNLKPGSQFQLFAADYLITADGQVKLLEINAFPDFVDNSSKKTKIYKIMFEDIGARIRRKLWKTKKSLVGMIENENFSENKAIEQVATSEDL